MIFAALRDLAFMALITVGLLCVFVLIANELRARGIVLGAAAPEAAALAGCQCSSCLELADCLGPQGDPFDPSYVSPSVFDCPKCGAASGASCVRPAGYPVYVYCGERLGLRDSLRSVIAGPAGKGAEVLPSPAGPSERRELLRLLK